MSLFIRLDLTYLEYSEHLIIKFTKINSINKSVVFVIFGVANVS